MSKYACRQRLFLTLALCVASQAVLAQPSNAANQQIDLTGDWIDNHHEVTLSVSGTTVTATYKEPIHCKRSDGSQDSTTKDFKGELSPGRPMTLTGSPNDADEKGASICAWGTTNQCGVEGFTKTRFNLKVSEDGQTLDGTFFDCHDRKDASMVLTRSHCDDVVKRFDAANGQGPLQLFDECKKDQSQVGECPTSTAPYCAVADCFGSRGINDHAQVVQWSPATAPGLLADFGRLVASLLSWPPLPPVAVLVDLPRDPVLITKDSCENALRLMGKALENISAMGKQPQQQAQVAVMRCLVNFCRTRGWRTPSDFDLGLP